jgi:hypothetical protein
MIIGSSEEAFSMGELSFYTHCLRAMPHVKLAYVNGLKCTCGKLFPKCNFWRRVDDIVKEEAPIVKKRGLEDTAKIFLNILNPLEKHLSFTTKKSKNKKVLDGVYKTAKKKKPKLRYLVDSSKDPRRLYELLKDSGFDNKDILVLYLVRDGRAYVNSYRKEVNLNPDHKGRNMFVSAFEWIGVHFVCKILLSKYGQKHMVIRYHDFAKNPQYTIDKLFDFLCVGGSDLDQIIAKLNRQKYHNLQGNPIKRKKISKIEYDQSWKQELGWFSKIVLTIIFSPFNRFFVFKNN